jgi:hypothetical protein
MPLTVCSIEGCAQPANVPGSARGWCRGHYKRWLRRGDPASPTPVPKRRSATDRFWEKVAKGEPGSCWEWQGSRDELGYGFFRVRSNETMRKAHRVAWELTYGPIPPGQQVCHRCDNPPCCNPADLFLGTHADNMADRNHKGRSTKGRIAHCGEHSGRAAKLTLVDVQDITRSYAAGGISQRELGIRYGVSQTQIGRIIRGDRWRLARLMAP